MAYLITKGAKWMSRKNFSHFSHIKLWNLLYFHNSIRKFSSTDVFCTSFLLIINANWLSIRSTFYSTWLFEWFIWAILIALRLLIGGSSKNLWNYTRLSDFSYPSLHSSAKPTINKFLDKYWIWRPIVT